MAHWNEFNRFSSELAYVPVEELAECAAGGTVRLRGGDVVPYTAEVVMEEWLSQGDRLDAYVIPREDGKHWAGVRHGAGDSEYISVHIRNRELFDALMERHVPGVGQEASFR